jgi:phospholipid/cholesterol/gamma-HCH transport system substrate-binding protein
MENKSHALAAGAFVLLLIALLLAMAAWLMRDTNEKRHYAFSSQDAVTGLQPQAGVRYKGVPVGRVTAIELDPKARGKVLVHMALNDTVPVTTSTFASLGFQGVTGLAFVQLDDPAPDSAVLAAGDEARIPLRPGLVSRLTEQGVSLLGQLDQAGQRINQLLAADNQQQLMRTLESLNQAAGGITQLARHTDELITGQGTPGSPSLAQLAAQTDATIRSIQATSERLGASAEAMRNSANEFRRVSVRMTEPGGTLEKIERGTDTLTAAGQALNASVVPRLSRTVDDAARSARQVGRVADTLSENPMSIFTGRVAPRPGPGEPGFIAPASQ